MISLSEKENNYLENRVFYTVLDSLEDMLEKCRKTNKNGKHPLKNNLKNYQEKNIDPSYYRGELIGYEK